MFSAPPPKSELPTGYAEALLLGTADPRREREIEQVLIDHIERFLIELSAGFASVGRQMPFEVGKRSAFATRAMARRSAP